MSDNISRQSALDALKAIRYGLWEIDIPSPAGCPEYVEHHEQIQNMMGVVDGWIKKISEEESTDSKGHWMSFEQVADMLSWMFGKCACDVNGNDEWLPLACKYADTECPHPKEENGCWMQFLLQGGADMRGGDPE